METFFRQRIAPPKFEGDPLKTSRASLLNTILWINILVMLLAVWITIAGYRDRPMMIIVPVLSLPLMLGLRWLMNRGQVYQASILLVILFSLGVTAIILIVGTIRSPAVAFYLLGILMAGLLLNQRAMLATVLANSLVLLGVLIAEFNHWLVAPLTPHPLYSWIAYLMLFASAGIYVHMALRSTYQALTSARAELTERRRVSLALEESQARIRALLEAIPDMMFELDRNGIIINFLPARNITTLIPPEQFLRRRIDEVLPLQIANPALRAIQSVLQTGEVQKFEYELDGPDAAHTYETRLSAINAEAVLCIVREITERVMAERQIRESEERYRITLEHIDEIVYMIRQTGDDPYQGLPVFVSGRVEQILGYKASDFQEHPDLWLSLAHPDDLPVMREQIQVLYETRQPVTREYRLRCKDFTQYRFIEDRVVPQMDETDNIIAIFGVARDITARKQAEERLRHYLELFSALYDTSLEISAQLDLQSLLQTIIERAALLLDAPIGIFGLVPPEGNQVQIVATHNFPIDPDCNCLKFGEGLQGLVASTGEAKTLGDYQQWPGKLEMLDLSINRSAISVPIIWQGEVVGTIGLFDNRPDRFGPQDVETLRLFAAQSAAAIQNARLYQAARQQVVELKLLHAIAITGAGAPDEHTLIERFLEVTGENYAPHIFEVMVLDPTMQVLRLHPSQRNLLDRMPESIVPLGQGVCGTVALNGEPRRVANVSQAPEYIPTFPSSRSELCVPLKVHNEILGVINVESSELDAFHPDDERLLVTIAGQLASTMVRLRAESERLKLIAELEARNAELERFTYTVSHELKTPLVTIRGFLGYLQQDAHQGRTDRLEADMLRISLATERMDHLLDELLKLSRAGHTLNTPEEIPFQEIVAQALESLEVQLARDMLTVEVAPEMPVVFGDRTRLVEAVLNLLENAIKFMGGQPQPRIEIGTRPSPEGEIFWVRDNGIGIDPAHHTRIFRLFDKLDPASDGSGVGLALVQRIIALHGGRIWVESEGAGSGSTFNFTLPFQQAIKS